MRGIILAAGRGARLNGSSAEAPKCLVKVGGVTLIERQIALLRNAGIDDIAIVVGFQADKVRRVCGYDFTYVENTRFAQTNSLYSLWMARALLCEGFVVLNCDVLFHPVLLEDLLSARHEDAALLAYRELDDPEFGEEEMKVNVRAGRVVEMSKQMDPRDADAENVGILKFGSRGATKLVQILEQRVAAGALRDWAPRAFSDFARIRPLHAIGTRGYPWIEIDFPDDYQRAVRTILPEIEGEPADAGGTDPSIPALAAGDLR